MEQPRTADADKTVTTDDQGNTPRGDEDKPLADTERSDVLARLRERFSFG